jgi:drug/metabolite transporter (DMT)-like permease
VRLKEWGAFWLLGIVWGSTFLWIKIGVGYLPPFTVAAIRQLIGLAGLLVVLAVWKQPLPLDAVRLRLYAIQGTLQAGLPFALIAWGETRIDSGLAAILNGTMPLFVILIAHFWLHDERITPQRVLGLIVGFAGVLVLGSRDIGPGGLGATAWGQVALLVATMSYAAAATFSRRYLRGEPPLVQASMAVLMGDVFLWITVAAFERPLQVSPAPMFWIAVGWLGLLASCLAYVLYFYLINVWGATRASVVTYVFPVVGLILGIVFMGERLDARLTLGSLLVVSGIAVVGRAPLGRPDPTPATAAVE